MSFLYLDNKKYENKIYPGIYVDKLYIGGLERRDAGDCVKNHFYPMLEQEITLVFEDIKLLLRPSQVIKINVQETVLKAFNHLRSESLIEGFVARRKLRQSPDKLKVIFEFKDDEELLAELRQTIYKEPKNAFFKVERNSIKIIEDVQGRILDEISLKEQIINAVLSNQSVITVPVKQINAEKTASDLERLEIKVKCAEFSTKFNVNLKERTENIKLAAEKLDGYIIVPGEVFSFNGVIGERSKQKGYKEAPIFVNNRTVLGVGGGVCQLSSTIYNLVLLTDLEVVERSNHSLPVSYVPLGRDATVNYDTIDFKFRNNTDMHLLIHANVEDDTLSVAFFGRETIQKNINLYSDTIKTIPPPVKTKKISTLEKGTSITQPGSEGYQVKLWKIFEVDGKKTREVVSIDTYNPVPTIVYVGDKEPAGEQTVLDEPSNFMDFHINQNDLD
ncbi:MAG: VanW family protein [Tepidanaerobacteraceae bacterium]